MNCGGFALVFGVGFLALIQDAEAQQLEAGSAIHLAFDELEPVNLSFDVALAPRQSECFAHGVDIPFETSGEAFQGGTSCGVKPSR